VVPLVTIAGVHFLYQSFSYQLFSFFTSSVRVEAPDILFDIVLSFLIRKKGLTGLRSLIATTSPPNSIDSNIEDLLIPTFESAISNSPKLVRLKPDDQYIWFCYNKRLFRFQRSKQLGKTGLVIKEIITLTVFGFWIQPVQDLIAEIYH
jgi:BCS1 N terminal